MLCNCFRVYTKFSFEALRELNEWQDLTVRGCFFSIEIRHKGILVLNMSAFALGKLYKVRVPRVGIISLAGAATSIIFVGIKDLS